MKIRLLFFILWTCLTTNHAIGQSLTTDADSKYATQLLKKGEKAPDFSLKNPAGKTIKFSKVSKGKYTVIDFWAAWCPDCRKDMPNVERLYKKFHPRGVEFIGVSFDTSVENWKKAIEQYQIGYTQVSELKKFRETAIAKAYGVNWIPTMYLIDPQGNVVLGTVLTDKIEKELTEIFAEPAKAKSEQKELNIEFKGKKLSATLLKPQLPETCRQPIAILMHGFGGEKDQKLLKNIAESLSEKGIATLRFDFTGHGKSEGKFEEMTVPEQIEEAKEMVRYVKSLDFTGDIALVGYSQGGIVAAMLAGELADEKSIKSVALLAPAGVIREDAIRGFSGGYTFDPLDPPAQLELWDGAKLGRNYLKTAQKLKIYDTAARYKGHALIIHGTADRTVPWSYGERFSETWPGSRLELLEGYDHGFTLNPYRISEIITTFLGQTLNKE